MTARNHDIIVVGMELGGLIAASLLVKRGKNVLVADPSGGRFLFDNTQLSLAPSPNLMAGLGSGGFVASIFQELDIPIHRRREFTPAKPVYQVVLPGSRVDVVGDRGELAHKLALPFGGEAKALSTWFEEGDRVDARLHETLRADDLLPAPGLIRGRGQSQAVRELDRALAPEDRVSFESELKGLTPEGRAFLTASVAFLTRFGHPEIESVLARFHLGQTREGLHQAPGGIGQLTGLIKEKIASLRGGFCQAEGVSEIKIGRSPHFQIKLDGLTDDFTAGALIWNTDPEPLNQWLSGRTRRSLKRSVPDATGAAVVTIVVRIKSVGLPVGMHDDCVIVSDPDKPLSGTNMLVVSVPPGDREKEECALNVSFRLDDAAGWDKSTAEKAGKEVLQVLRDPIPFIDEYLIAVDSADAVKRLESQRYERSVPSHILPLGEGGTRIRTTDPNIFYTGRDALCGLGMVGETVAGRLTADYLTIQR